MNGRGPKDELLALERGFWEAAGDASYYTEHFHDEGVMLLPHLPHPMDKAAVLESVAQASPWSAFSIDDPTFATPLPDVTVLAYRAKAQRTDEAPYQALVSSVYVRQNDAWALLSHQQTPLKA